MNRRIKRDILREADFKSVFPETPVVFDEAIRRGGSMIRRDNRARRRRGLRFAAAAALVFCVGGGLLLLPESEPTSREMNLEPINSPLHEDLLADNTETPASIEADSARRDPVQTEAPQTSDDYSSTASLEIRYISDMDAYYHKDSLCPRRGGELKPFPLDEVLSRELLPCPECCGGE